MKITIVGASPPILSIRPNHAGSGIVVTDDNGESILLDCGPNVLAALGETDIAPSSIRSIYLTHHHWDHISDVPVMVLGRWEIAMIEEGKQGKIPQPIDIYGPDGTVRIVEQLFHPDGVYGSDIATRMAPEIGGRLYRVHGAPENYPSPVPGAHDLAAGVSHQDGPFEIVTARMGHCQPYFDSLAYRVNTSSGSVAYSGDGGPCQEMVDLAKGVDLLIHEMNLPDAATLDMERGKIHSTTRSVAETAAAAGAKHLLIFHHRLEPDAVEQREAVIAEVREIFDGQVTIADRFTRIETAAASTIQA